MSNSSRLLLICIYVLFLASADNSCYISQCGCPPFAHTWCDENNHKITSSFCTTNQDTCENYCGGTHCSDDAVVVTTDCEPTTIAVTFGNVTANFDILDRVELGGSVAFWCNQGDSSLAGQIAFHCGADKTFLPYDSADGTHGFCQNATTYQPVAAKCSLPADLPAHVVRTGCEGSNTVANCDFQCEEGYYALGMGLKCEFNVGVFDLSEMLCIADGEFPKCNSEEMHHFQFVNHYDRDTTCCANIFQAQPHCKGKEPGKTCQFAYGTNNFECQMATCAEKQALNSTFCSDNNLIWKEDLANLGCTSDLADCVDTDFCCAVTCSDKRAENEDFCTDSGMVWKANLTSIPCGTHLGICSERVNVCCEFEEHE